MITWMIRLENLVLAAVGFILYWQLGYNWWLFVLLILTPDISMVGYLINLQWGARLYNIVHSYILAIALIGMGWLVADADWLTMYGLILLCHIGMDRFLGFGLKYPTGFKNTHLQRLND